MESQTRTRGEGDKVGDGFNNPLEKENKLTEKLSNESVEKIFATRVLNFAPAREKQGYIGKIDIENKNAFMIVYKLKHNASGRGRYRVKDVCGIVSSFGRVSIPVYAPLIDKDGHEFRNETVEKDRFVIEWIQGPQLKQASLATFDAKTYWITASELKCTRIVIPDVLVWDVQICPEISLTDTLEDMVGKFKDARKRQEEIYKIGNIHMYKEEMLELERRKVVREAMKENKKILKFNLIAALALFTFFYFFIYPALLREDLWEEEKEKIVEVVPWYARVVNFIDVFGYFNY